MYFPKLNPVYIYIVIVIYYHIDISNKLFTIVTIFPFIKHNTVILVSVAVS